MNSKDLRDLVVFIQNMILKKFELGSISDLQKRITRLISDSQDSRRSRDQGSGSFIVEEMTISLIVPSLSCELQYLIESESPDIKASKLKELLELFWTTIGFLGGSRVLKLMNILKEQLLRIWNLKVLQGLMDVMYYITLLFKRKYQGSQMDSDLNWDYKTQTSEMKLFDDHPIFMLLASNTDYLK